MIAPTTPASPTPTEAFGEYFGVMLRARQGDKAAFQRAALLERIIGGALQDPGADTARVDAIERGEIEIECMGSTVHYQIVHGPAGTFVASPSDVRPRTLREAMDAARGAGEASRADHE
jgi:hypothetical protein